ncbi:hypothetical protein AWC38_SpisGene22813 [Stylophora pistillata]|uniref:Uncharacterized protein n=1 Tax=Stylophora pistillata TaxID=50429 RepID=A0A2B4R8I3_STYPI|nr:hypothetical protein AWC38_SpisGene22813 [Stylophora pistillata]
MTSKSEDSDVTEITEKKNRTGTSGVEKQKQKDILLIQIKRRKRTAKRKVTNLRHEITDIKSVIEPLWAALEDAQEILEEITAFYVEVRVKEQAVKTEPFEESEAIERDREHNRSLPAIGNQLNESHGSHDGNIYLKPLTVPTFSGDKRKFEDVWARFTSLVDESTEQVHFKMARLRQCLTGKALEAIRGLEVTANEYQEAKQILKTKYEGTRRVLPAYLDQLEQALLIRRNDIYALEKFADLVRISGKVTGRTKRSLDSDGEGVELYHQLKELWAVASMQTRKWISNSPKVIGAISSEENTTKIVINSGQDPITKSLGIPWNGTEDVFTFAASPVSSDFSDNKGKRPA